ncbi:MAG: hypothetical protein ACO38P_06855, partial [Phycisphaerales bacterium]
MNRTIPHVLSRLPLVATIATIAALAPLAACTGGEAPKAAMEEPAAGPTNRIDIPDAVRRNLGIEFARVEPRQVERTIRLPGRFELV